MVEIDGSFLINFLRNGTRERPAEPRADVPIRL
jgi:hypothetical protein